MGLAMPPARRRIYAVLVVVLVGAIALVGYRIFSARQNAGNPAPPRVTAAADVPPLTSTMAVPITVDLDVLERRLDLRIPKVLTTIDKVEKACVPAQRLTLCLKRDEEGKCKIGLDKAKITPDIACRIVGEVRRGPVKLSGDGNAMKLVMPIEAQIRASDAKDKLAGKTATAAAEVRADIRLDLDPRWQPRAKVTIDYDWTEKPGISLLGARITFAGKADRALEPHIRALEGSLPAELGKFHSRRILEKTWEQGFATISLNKRNPPVWLRITPQTLHVDPWVIKDRKLTLPLAVTAYTETFIGDRPEPRPSTPLPPPGPALGAQGVRMNLPITADYKELEPVLARALGKLSKKGLKLADYGRADVKFGDVTLYPTTGGRLAVGMEIEAHSPLRLINAKGVLWLTAIPRNDADSQKVRFTDLQLASRTDSPGFEFLVAISQEPEVRAGLEAALVQDFSKDYNKLLARIEPRLAALPIGRDFIIRAVLDEIHNGQVAVLGEGLYMPVQIAGTATLELARTPNPSPPVKLPPSPPDPPQ
ncbi:DUF4403 family protein [Polymorphobacter sp.]|uniref:DUF4403 family protein n=1 Tax=Polymorphobacter sp. TaxID=1909290 RepID=UPI003F6EEC38